MAFPVVTKISHFHTVLVIQKLFLQVMNNSTLVYKTASTILSIA